MPTANQLTARFGASLYRARWDVACHSVSSKPRAPEPTSFPNGGNRCGAVFPRTQTPAALGHNRYFPRRANFELAWSTNKGERPRAATLDATRAETRAREAQGQKNCSFRGLNGGQRGIRTPPSYRSRSMSSLSGTVATPIAPVLRGHVNVVTTLVL